MFILFCKCPSQIGQERMFKDKDSNTGQSAYQYAKMAHDQNLTVFVVYHDITHTFIYPFLKNRFTNQRGRQ